MATKMKTKKSKPTRADANKVWWWCVNEYGRSKINGSYPHLEFRKFNYYDDELAYGYYDEIENVICVNRLTNKTLIDLIDTVIHEWTHYHQPIKSHIRRMAKEGRVDELFEDHDPLEREAQKIAYRDAERCYQELYLVP